MFAVPSVFAVPQIISYQGRVSVNNINFDGAGSFRFALVNETGTLTYWSNDGTSTAGSEPTAPVSLTVTQGLYSVLPGDVALTNMTAVPASVFENDPVYLRVYFDDGSNGSQLLAPDQRIAAVGYSIISATVSDAAITASKLATGAVTADKLGAMAIIGSAIADGTITPDKLSTTAATDNVDSIEIVTISANPAATELVDAGYLVVGSFDSEDAWSATSTAGGVTPRTNFASVWTGTDMIVWGGLDGGATPTNTGERYNPVTDSWTPITNAGAPTARDGAIAVWTGTEMIVWGGGDFSTQHNTGGRYDPLSNSWTPTTLPGGLAGRINHSLVWTGTEMIVWGGVSGSVRTNTGGRYNPAGDSWNFTTLTFAPVVRQLHTAIWTGTDMIVWGGNGSSGNALNSGGRYNPATNAWSNIATMGPGAPAGRWDHTAVWTGTEMIVWGGWSPVTNTGGRYNPTTNSWTPTTFTGTPEARYNHTAVWTGDEMIIWGGVTSSASDTGGRYDPALDTWTATPLNALTPEPRSNHAAHWTGDEMLIWGGGLNTGGRFRFGPTLYVYKKP